MTGAEFLAYVIRKFKRTDKSTEIYQATTDIIADMRLQFDSEDYKEEAYIVGIDTLGDYRIATPNDFGHIIGNVTCVDVDSNSNRELNKISKAAYDEKYSDRLYSSVGDISTGEPVDFCIYGKQIFVGPVPDSITYKYQINYTTEDYSEVDADTDPVPFSDRYRNILRQGVLMELHDGLENYEESGYWRALYTDGLGKIVGNDEDNIQDNDAVSFSGV